MKRLTVLLTVFVMLTCVGCESPSDGKKAAQERWEKATARMNLDMANQEYNAMNFQQSAKAVEQSLHFDPSIPAAHLLNGKLLLAQGQPDKAEFELHTALQLNEKLYEAWYWLGVVAQQKKDYEKARSYYSKAMSMSPLEVDYIIAVAEADVALDRCDRAVALLEHKMVALPDNIPLIVTAADLTLREGNNEKATQLYTQALHLRPQDNGISESLAYCHILGQRWNEAVKIFERLSAHCTDFDKRKIYHRMLGVCNMNAARYSQAKNFYTKLSAEEQDDADVWLQIGQAALGSGEAQRAFVCSQRALSLKPEWPDAMVLKGCAQYMLKNYVAALETFQGTTENQENSALVWLMKGRCHQKLGNIEEARQAYKKSLKLKPNSELAKFLADSAGSAGF